MAPNRRGAAYPDRAGVYPILIMAEHLRRFEILVPLRFNNGSAVPDELLEQTKEELKDAFGGLSSESQIIHGFDRDTTGEDKMARVYADVPDTAESLAYFLSAKERLQDRFQQEEIRITHYAVEAL